MAITPNALKALRIVSEHGPINGNRFADYMWPDSPAHKHLTRAGNGVRQGAGMWRAGGSYLAVLAKRGLLTRTSRRLGQTLSPEYILSRAGREAIRENLAEK